MQKFARYVKGVFSAVIMTSLLTFGMLALLKIFLPEIWSNETKQGAAVLGALILSALATWFSMRGKKAERRIVFRKDRIPQNGHDFEVWVAKILRQNGWKCEVTPGSGDQGVDVIATRGRVRLGIQCKRYSRSVGNKAVQEIYAGQAYHRLTHAAVVTTSWYTDSAKALAKRTGVHLLTCEQLPGLSTRIK